MITKVSDLFPNSVKLSWRTRWILRRAGWIPTRSVAISEWTNRLTVDKWFLTSEVETILKSFGGLMVNNRSCGILLSTIELNPLKACDLEEHSYVERVLEPLVSDRLCVIGTWNQIGTILIGQKGVYLFVENCVAIIGHCWIEALEMLLSSKGKNLIWRSSIDDRSNVMLDGMPTSAQ